MAPGRTARHTHAAHFVGDKRRFNVAYRGGICRFYGRYLIYKSTMGIFLFVVKREAVIAEVSKK
jgi:hypothetical protein